MKINNITAYQNPRPNFKGAYVLKGNCIDTTIASGLIGNNCNDEYSREYNPNGRFYPGFYKYTTRFLHETYDDEQPNIYKLILTNEHTANLDSWWEIHGSKPKIIDVTGAKGLIMAHSETGPKPLSLIEIIDNYVNKKNAPYINAKKALESGNEEPMNDLLLDLYLEAKKNLQQIIDCAVVPMKKVEVLDVAEVIKAIQNKKFNFITGVIKK